MPGEADQNSKNGAEHDREERHFDRDPNTSQERPSKRPQSHQVKIVAHLTPPVRIHWYGPDRWRDAVTPRHSRQRSINCGEEVSTRNGVSAYSGLLRICRIVPFD